MKYKITPYGIFKDLMKCFITACGIMLLIVFFDTESLFFQEGKLMRDSIRSGTYAIFSILLFGTICWRVLEMELFKRDNSHKEE